jgi:pyruvate,orthophosphate dikinase
MEIGWIALSGPAPDPALHGEKAAFLAVAHAAGLDVPPGFALPPGFDGDIGEPLARLECAAGGRLGDGRDPLLVSVRPAAEMPAGGVAPAILNIGVTSATLPALAVRYGERTARDLHRRLIQAYGAAALGVEGEEFEYALHDALRYAGCESETELNAAQLAELAETCLALIGEAGAGPFPDDARAQLDGALRTLPVLWSGRRAAARRRAMGAGDAPLGIIVQVMALGLGRGPCGAGLVQLRDEQTGAPALTGRYLSQAQGEDALMGLRTPQVITAEERLRLGLHEPSLEETAPQAVPTLREAGHRLEAAIGDAVGLEFTLAEGRLHILEVKRARRSARAAVQIAVDLAAAGAIDRETALMRVDPAHLEEQLHPAIDRAALRDLAGEGLPASPGAASGPLVFSPDAAEAAAQRNGSGILALIETGPEDIRGMHAARGVLTVRGGMTSHAAVVARGLGKPCVVGARGFVLDRTAGTLRAPNGRVFHEGDVVTVDGTTGQVLAGSVPMVQPEATGAFATLLAWADEARRLGVRANADTARDAATAEGFGAQGIGLCRTEHMFFQQGRITAMREMILAGTEDERRTALGKLLPMQKGDFRSLFEAMPGRPVTVRLLDPPLHEFLPHGDAEMREMAASLGVPVAKIAARAAELDEFNPMLGKRGCRIGIAYPEIYEMQARAIFEAALEAGRATGSPVRPEIMIPLVSAVRELEMLSATIDRVAGAVRDEQGEMVEFTVGVMVETPRACLRAGEIAGHAGFLSFGTNDLTQMLYGLSRDDAGRFMLDYVSRGVFPHDPFHTLDLDGVGEMMKVAIERARARRPDISIGICGEHGGDPRSIEFCERAGFDYVSCSPFRIPVARLAAAQAAIRARAARAAEAL